MFNQLGLIGCGLMGGSFALALKKAGLVRRVVGYSKSPSTVEKARRLGVIDVAAESALLAVSGSDIVLIAVPVAASENTFKAIRHLVDPGVLFMDVGSTKRDVVDAARRVLKERLPSFVPAHPIAGREVAGIEHADPGLYQGRKVILTPLPQTDATLVQKATDVWAAIGCQVLKMRPENHDAAYAAVSHLPHLLAFAAVRALAGQPRAADFLGLAGPGFRDFTRIAASDPDVWRDILLANAAQVRTQARHFRAALDTFEAALDAGDAHTLRELIAEASRIRTQWAAGAYAATPPSSDPPCTAPPSSTSPR